jgi:hypothetical protein
VATKIMKIWKSQCHPRFAAMGPEIMAVLWLEEGKMSDLHVANRTQKEVQNGYSDSSLMYKVEISAISGAIEFR